MAVTAKLQEPDAMVINSGCATHMTALSKTIEVKANCNECTALGDNSIVTATEKSVQKVCWHGSDGAIDVSLSDTLIAQMWLLVFCPFRH